MALTLAHAYFDAWCPEGWTWGDSIVPFDDCDLWCVRDGEGWIELDGAKVRSIGRGVCIAFRPGMTVKAWHNPQKPLRVWAQHFSVSGKDGSLLPPVWTDAGDMLFYEALFDRMSRLRAWGDAASQDALFRAVLASLCAESSHRVERGYEPYMVQGLHDAHALIRAHPEKRFANVELAYAAGMHPNYFVRAFTRYFGHAPRQLAMRLRCDVAGQWLRESGMSVKQIAAALGYPDQASFSKQFRSVTGVSPMAVRSGTHRHRA